MNYIFPTLLCLAMIAGCSQSDIDSHAQSSSQNPNTPYYHDLGDIAHDPLIDKQLFILCDSTRTMQGRSALRYPRGVGALEEICLSTFEYRPAFEVFSGYVTIRFMINCKNESGRFRAQALDLDFSPKECPNELKEQLLGIVENLNGWKKSTSFPPKAEYSKYINFKIDHGRIEHVLI